MNQQPQNMAVSNLNYQAVASNGQLDENIIKRIRESRQRGAKNPIIMQNTVENQLMLSYTN